MLYYLPHILALIVLRISKSVSNKTRISPAIMCRDDMGDGTDETGNAVIQGAVAV